MCRSVTINNREIRLIPWQTAGPGVFYFSQYFGFVDSDLIQLGELPAVSVLCNLFCFTKMLNGGCVLMFWIVLRWFSVGSISHLSVQHVVCICAFVQACGCACMVV